MRSRSRRSISTAALAAIIIVVIVIVAVGGYLAYVSTRHHVTTTTPTTTTTSTTSTTTSSTTTTTTTTTFTTTTTTTTPPPTTTTQVVTLTVADSYSTSENIAFNKSLAAFEQEYPWIHVEVEYGAGVGTSPYTSEAQAHDAPIIIRDTSDSAGALFAAGILVNLSQYLPQSYFQRFNPTAIEDWTLNGSVYGLPDNINYIVMFYNKKYVPEPPNTTDQLIQIAEQVNKSGVWGIAYGASDEYGYRFAAWFAGFGGQIFVTQNGKVVPALNSTAMVNALNFWYNLTYNLKINYLAPSTGAGGAEGQLFMENKAAIIFDGPWDLKPYFQALGCDLGAAPLPVVSQTGLYAEPFIGSTGWSITTPQANGVPASQWNATLHAALLFIEFMTNYSNEYGLFEYAGDIPALNSAYQAALQNLSAPTSNQTLACLHQVIKGILEQSQHGQKFPNVPQMAYYWNSFHQYASEFFAGKINAQQAAQGMEQAFVSSLQSAGLLSPAQLPPSEVLTAPELPASRY
ncbi:Maltose/trehalose/maltodextrin ABC-transporter, extracellular substrate-binding protein [Acidilobus saccharovorans 345-15]|uniref:Maltose/trehalose/maltodextrin ABC-transporter, extracellular substrate-binding protein n=1 Tax=Acidilobus saccharovorans (strain DSM 16705 / JCM 18335 / VKM B-2471 / 345-15) TaxID=666510 RepID=D9PZK8_ACIS3|nr:extracellular solute-binding protein [Acidilobus saccharovorans]ADL18496.1 Maltose/trehalose/maltodextrin ABC-transporter, extracellular substrate-binding protein [Acidilobus saccharovorans 345-15]